MLGIVQDFEDTVMEKPDKRLCHLGTYIVVEEDR